MRSQSKELPRCGSILTICILIFAFGLGIYSNVQGVMSDDELLNKGIKAFEEGRNDNGQYVEALKYLFAYQQRNPQKLQNDPKLDRKIVQNIDNICKFLNDKVNEAKTLRTDLAECQKKRYTSEYQKIPAEKLMNILLTVPILVSPEAGKVFHHYPRVTTLRWKKVGGATSYTVEVDCFGCCQAGKWCADVGGNTTLTKNVTSTQHTFNFGGAQPGRWRVWAVDADGKVGPKSNWQEFRYTQ
ncbi:MAG: hypothetical protein GY855_12330 [candidate division Zixibacteria bacterium]|nr:hypothetical protein [candidate division Zixibacteria bacterium]